jgi:putative glycerol-1-phosphate prenyltransferase
MNIYKQIISAKKKSLAILIDPDKAPENHLKKLAQYFNSGYADFAFVGGSIVNSSTNKTIKKLKSLSNIPIILFPGNPLQISFQADAILFLSLISGRNPDFLIGHHIHIAKQIKKNSIETIPTGYILIDSGKTTSIQYISNTMPIPADKPDIAVATAIAGELLGMKLIYLEAGSGAKKTINSKIIRQIKKNIKIPLIVGGGIKTTDDLQKYAKSGADIIVIGSIFEQEPSLIPKFYKTLNKINNA